MSKDVKHYAVDLRQHNAFWPVWLDDIRTLDTYAVRVYLRLLRRVGSNTCSWASVADLADGTSMSERRARQALKSLEEHKLIHREFRKNQTTLYYILPAQTRAAAAAGLTNGSGQTADYSGDDCSFVPPRGEPRADEGTTRESTTNERTTKEKESSRSLKNQAQEIVDLYNEHRGTEPNAMPRVDLLNKGRHQRIKQAINDYGFEKVKELMVKACKNRVADPERFYAKNNHGLDALLADQKFVKYAEAWDHQQTQQQQAQPDVRLRANEKQWAYEDATEEWLALTPEERETITIDDLAARNEERMLNEKRNRNQND